MLNRDDIERSNAEEREKRKALVAGWNAEFTKWAGEGDRILYKYTNAPRMAPETVTDVWAELPRYGGIVVAVQTSRGRILSPWYDQDPNDGEEELVQQNPDAYLDYMLGATDFETWTDYPTTGIRYWGGE